MFSKASGVARGCGQKWPWAIPRQDSGLARMGEIVIQRIYRTSATGTWRRTSGALPVAPRGMQQLPNVVSAGAHDLEPARRDRSQFARVVAHPEFDGWIALD